MEQGPRHLGFGVQHPGLSVGLVTSFQTIPEPAPDPHDPVQHEASLAKRTHHWEEVLTPPVPRPHIPCSFAFGGGVCLCWTLKSLLSGEHSVATAGCEVLCFSCEVGSRGRPEGGAEAGSEPIAGGVLLAFVPMPPDPGGRRKTHVILASRVPWTFSPQSSFFYKQPNLRPVFKGIRLSLNNLNSSDLRMRTARLQIANHVLSRSVLRLSLRAGSLPKGRHTEPAGAPRAPDPQPCERPPSAHPASFVVSESHEGPGSPVAREEGEGETGAKPRAGGFESGVSEVNLRKGPALPWVPAGGAAVQGTLAAGERRSAR